MPERRLPDSAYWRQKEICRDPDHEPMGMIVREPGTYEHICPRCHKKTIFVVPERPTLSNA